MALYLPASVRQIPRKKLLPPRVEFVGAPRLDMGQGHITMEAVGLLVDEAGEPLLDAQGQQQLEGTGVVLTEDLQTAVAFEHGGITGAQVLEFLGAYFDSRVAASGMVLEAAE